MRLRKLLGALLALAILCAVLPGASLADTEAEEGAGADAQAVFSEEENYAGEEMEQQDTDVYGDDSEEQADTTTYKTLKRGDKDGDDSAANVVILQNKLIELGYLLDDADGAYGANTEEAVKQFQKLNGLSETGVADSNTQQLLFNGTDLVPADASLDSKSVIYRVQTKLIQWGFMTGKADGVNGTTTKKAVASFKKYMEAYFEANPTPTPTPSPEPGTVEILGFEDGEIVIDEPLDNSKDSEITEQVLAFVDGEYEFDPYVETVQNGDKGDEPLRVQKKLRQLKYLYTADGSFGANSERALKYFQYKNGLEETGIADEATQLVLFSESPVKSEEYVSPYKLVVDISEQRVYLYQWDGRNYDTYLGKTVCTTGKKGYDTPTGTYQAVGPSGTGEWYYFKDYDCYAKWAFRIVGGIMFHSVTYSAGKKLNSYSVSNLGHRASHGCVRLEVAKAEWIYKNCPAGTTVVIQD